MKNLLALLLVTMATLGVLSHPGFSQDGHGTLHGTLLDAVTERPLRGATVRLIGSEVEAKTDIKGSFKITVPAGTYAGMVATRSEGSLSLIEASVEVVEGESEDLGEIELAPSAFTPPPSIVGPAPGPASEEGEGSPPPSAGEGPPSLPEGWQLHPWLGVHLTQIESDGSRGGENRTAALVTRVYPGSSADEAGVEPGDVLAEIEGEPVAGVREALRRIDSFPLGAPVEIEVHRDGRPISLTANLMPLPKAAVVAIWDLAEELEGSFPPVEGGEPGPPGQAGGGSVHPLLEEARRQTARGAFANADRAYEEYLAEHPQDGWVWAEYADMVFHNIQNAKGMALMAQAVKRPGLPPQEKTRLRLLIAQRRLESGNLTTARQMLVEAKREDPFNPFIDDLLHTIDLIVLQASGQAPVPGQAVPYGARAGTSADAQQVLVNELLGKIAKELTKD